MGATFLPVAKGWVQCSWSQGCVMSLFSVIIPTYGRPHFLEDAVRSVLNQSVQDVEIVVVDDASPRPVELLTPDPRVRVIRRGVNGGPAAGRNSGLDVAAGSYITFLDDDDTFVPERLEFALDGLTSADVTVCFSSDNQRILEGDVRSVIGTAITPRVGTTTVRREAMLYFDERFRSCEDVEWWIRIAQQSQVSTVPKVGYLVRHHEGERYGHGLEQRSRDSVRLLHLHAEYFRSYPAAAAFRWKRAGLMASTRRRSVSCLAQSFIAEPSWKTLAHIARRSIVSKPG
jgi:glycosyltransferase involved in cell wall biosynthesis